MKDKLTSLIAGPTDKTKIIRFGSISQDAYEDFLNRRGEILARHLSQVNVIPDDGVPLDIAKAYKRAGGESVVGYIPKGGFPSLERYFEFCDRVEEFDLGWSGLNTCLSLRGDLVTVFGMSSGTIVEIAYTKFHKKYLGKELPVLIDRNTTVGVMTPELLDEVNLQYFSSSDQLDLILGGLRG